MLGIIGMVVGWLGYSLGFYGWNRITGGNDTFKSLIWPGAYSYTPRDGQGTSTSSTGQGAPPKPPNSSSAPASAGLSGPGYSVGGGGTGGQPGFVHP